MFNPSAVIDSWERPSPEIKYLVDVFISPEGLGRRYLLGRNKYSAGLSKLINIEGFVDDFADAGDIWYGKPVLKRADLPNCAILVNCAMDVRPVSASKGLDELGVFGVLAYVDLCRTLPDRFRLPSFVLETRSDFQLNQSKWALLSAALADDVSRNVLDDVLRFRFTGDYRYMSSYSFRPKDQYFEDFLKLKGNDVFVDGGGFDGDTTEEFCKRYKNYGKVYIFEPSANSIRKAKARLINHRDIEYIQQGLSDADGILNFNPDAGSASSISESGVSRIEVTTLDRKIDKPVTFIKMDLEGWELKALEGARRHVIEDYPNLAIAVYHTPSDFWKIFEFVFSLRQDYSIFLRHYTESWTETVMYFVPQVPGKL